MRRVDSLTGKFDWPPQHKPTKSDCTPSLLHSAVRESFPPTSRPNFMLLFVVITANRIGSRRLEPCFSLAWRKFESLMISLRAGDFRERPLLLEAHRGFRSALAARPLEGSSGAPRQSRCGDRHRKARCPQACQSIVARFNLRSRRLPAPNRRRASPPSKGIPRLPARAREKINCKAQFNVASRKEYGD